MSVRQVVVVGMDHELDPPIGTQLRLLEIEPQSADESADHYIVGWDPHRQEPDDAVRWPMMREQVRPAVAVVGRVA